MNKIVKFALSKSNIFGLVAACVPTVFLISGTIESFFIPILLGSYLTGFLIPKDNVLLSDYQNEDVTLEQIKEHFTEMHDLLNTESDKDLFELVNKIQIQTMNTWNSLSTQDENYFSLKKIVVDYLPKSINAYLKVPAFGRKLAIGEKSSYDMLLSQLTLLNKEVEEVNKNVIQVLSQDVKVQSKFLNQTFQQEKLLK